VRVCPVTAIFALEDVPREWANSRASTPSGTITKPPTRLDFRTQTSGCRSEPRSPYGPSNSLNHAKPYASARQPPKEIDRLQYGHARGPKQAPAPPATQTLAIFVVHSLFGPAVGSSRSELLSVGFRSQIAHATFTSTRDVLA
jgi:hypothetical protein